jgi:hypothetical protein
MVGGMTAEEKDAGPIVMAPSRNTEVGPWRSIAIGGNETDETAELQGDAMTRI